MSVTLLQGKYRKMVQEDGCLHMLVAKRPFFICLFVITKLLHSSFLHALMYVTTWIFNRLLPAITYSTRLMETALSGCIADSVKDSSYLGCYHSMVLFSVFQKAKLYFGPSSENSYQALLRILFWIVIGLLLYGPVFQCSKRHKYRVGATSMMFLSYLFYILYTFF